MVNIPDRPLLVGLLGVVVAAVTAILTYLVVPKCIPGVQQACSCGPGDPGQQTCSADGRFGICSCQITSPVQPRPAPSPPEPEAPGVEEPGSAPEPPRDPPPRPVVPRPSQRPFTPASVTPTEPPPVSPEPPAPYQGRRPAPVPIRPQLPPPYQGQRPALVPIRPQPPPPYQAQPPAPRPIQPQLHPSGYGLRVCGCWGPNPVPIEPAPQCASGRLRVNVCPHLPPCEVGHPQYAYVCL